MRAFLKVSVSVVALIAASPAVADPISLAIASTVSAVVGTTGGLAAFGFMGLTGFNAAMASFAMRAALGFALNALTNTPGAQSVSRGYTVNSLGAALPHQVIYGSTRVGGFLGYQALTNSDTYLHRIICFAGHEIDEYSNIYFNDEEITIDGAGEITAPAKWIGDARINIHLGTDDQAADADLVSEVAEWTTEHRMRGVAYLYVRFEGAANFPNGVPSVTALIKGKKVYDPRTLLTAWSDNPALCVRDYVRSGYGLAEPAINVNDVLFGAAATGCEEQVSTVADPETGFTATITRTDTTAVLNTDFTDFDENVLFAVDCTFPEAAATSGTLFETGGAANGVYLGFDIDGTFTAHAYLDQSDPAADQISIAADVSAHLGKSATVYFFIDTDFAGGPKGYLYLYDKTTQTLYDLGTDQATTQTAASTWADTGDGSFTQVNVAAVGDFVTAAWPGSFTEGRIYQTAIPDVVGWSAVEANRYTCNGAFLLDAAPEDIIRAMLSSMGGQFWFLQGQWATRMADYVVPTVSLDEGDLRGTLSIATRHSRRDNFNTVEGTYKGAETDYQATDFAPVTDAAFLTEDNNLEKGTSLDLLFTDTAAMARRIAALTLRRNRQQKTIQAPFGLKAMNVMVGDTVFITNSDAGWTNKVFECVDWRFAVKDTQDLHINMILREIDSAVFA